MENNEVIIFTNSYPYGRGEAFLGSELEVLSNRFSKIYLQPLTGSGEAKVVPSNVEILKPIFSDRNKFEIIWKGLLRFGPVGSFYKVFKGNIVQNIGYYLIARALISNPKVKRLSRELPVKYFYWGKGAASLIIFFKVPGFKIVRLHGYDLYESDEREGNFVPLRNELIRATSKFIFISEHGRNYFFKKYGITGELHRLGSKFHGQNPKGIDKSSFVLLSCSSLVSVKRVHLIVEMLQQIKNKVKWIHIGDGPELNSIEALILAMPSNVEVNFLGYFENHEIMKFYSENHVDLFINLSSSEGIPVSMMEAISFGIPLIGTDVGGVKEIISENTGILVDKNVDIEELAKTLDHLITLNYFNNLRKTAFEEYKRQFNAEFNAEQLAKFIKNQR